MMRCSKCGSDNPDGLRFCNQCGAAFSQPCLQCGFENAGGARFCGQCGTPIAAAPPAAHATRETIPAVEPSPSDARTRSGERRHLTVFFCDLVGSTEIAARLDPEEWREMVAAYHRAAAEAINRFGGHVAKFLGDGVMAYFGYPEAHDYDAERAVRAGLAIVEGLAFLNQQNGTGSLSSSVKLSARVGIDSGAVVVGAGVGTETEVFGDAPNIAARVQAAAAPDSVLISEATHRLVAGLFVVEDCGAQSLKGIGQPVELYRVVRPAGVRGRLAARAASRGLTPFIGRDEELNILTNRWQRVLGGEGQVALIAGEAGIGKSRLVQRFHQQIASLPHTWLEAAAAPFYQNTPFYPVAEALRQLVWEQIFDRFSDYLRKLQGNDDQASGSSGERSSDERLGQVESGLLSAGLEPAEAIPLLAPLLNLPLTPVTGPSSALSPEQQRRRLLATLIEWLLGAARTRPLVVVIEDLHWADPSTLELIQLLLEQGATARMLLLVTARPEFHPSWPLRAHHTQITLNRLSARSVREMIAQVAAQTALASETLDAVIERTSGVPLFVEELTRAVLESGNGNVVAREIPVTLHDSLMARLDRLGSAKEVLQIGSVIGGEFKYELLHAVHSINDDDLQRELHRLTEADLLHVRGLPPNATYQFKHALIRDAAYEALLKSRRKELHRLVAQTIEEKFADIKQTQPEVLARHWTEAGEFKPAIAEWLQAANAAEARNAIREAIESYRHALELVERLPDHQERAATELGLQVKLGVGLIATHGYAALAVEKAYMRARDLCQQIDDKEQLGPVLGGLWQFYIVRGQFELVRAIGEQVLALANSTRNPRLELEAHDALGQTFFALGELDRAKKHFEHSLRLYNPDQHDELVLLCGGEDPAIACLDFLALSLWLRGYADQALHASDQAFALAEKVRHPHSLAHALGLGATLRLLYRDRRTAESYADSLITLAVEHGFAGFSALGTVLRTAAIGHERLFGEEIPQIRQGLSAWQATGAVLLRPLLLGLLGQACKEADSIEEGLDVLAEAFAIVALSRERFYEAELHRLKGELLLISGSNKGEALTCFHQAIEIARGQDAKALELRSTMSLARLLDQQGRRGEARTMLAEIYDWFTEGFDTPDLIDAKALLDTLSAG